MGFDCIDKKWRAHPAPAPAVDRDTSCFEPQTNAENPVSCLFVGSFLMPLNHSWFVVPVAKDVHNWERSSAPIWVLDRFLLIDKGSNDRQRGRIQSASILEAIAIVRTGDGATGCGTGGLKGTISSL